MLAKIIGYKKLDFMAKNKQTGKEEHVKQTQYFVNFEDETDETIVGQCALKVSWNELTRGEAPYDIGDEIKLSYNKYGNLTIVQ